MRRKGHGAGHRKHRFQQFLCCCVLTHCHGNLFVCDRYLITGVHAPISLVPKTLNEHINTNGRPTNIRSLHKNNPYVIMNCKVADVSTMFEKNVILWLSPGWGPAAWISLHFGRFGPPNTIHFHCLYKFIFSWSQYFLILTMYVSTCIQILDTWPQSTEIQKLSWYAKSGTPDCEKNLKIVAEHALYEKTASRKKPTAALLPNVQVTVYLIQRGSYLCWSVHGSALHGDPCTAGCKAHTNFANKSVCLTFDNV
jgi:hypothetical protein